MLVVPPAAQAQAGRDTSRAPASRDSARSAADSLFARLFGPGSDLGLQFDARLEFRTERTRNERCTASQFTALGANCRGRFQPSPEFQFGLRMGGTVDRFATRVDYDSRREVDGSNVLALAYEGKPGEWLQRVEVGNVGFDAPASRYITSGIPQGNYGIQAMAKFGRLSVRAIAAEQKGIVQRDRVFTVGGTGAQAGALDIDDYTIEARRFFFVVDPRRLRGYPNIDVLDGAALQRAAAALPDSARPVRVTLYRLLIGGQPPNPNGPQFTLIGDPESRRGPVYEPLRENVDYYMDPSQLWVALAQPLDPNKERLVAAYTVRVAGQETVVATAGGTPDLIRVDSREQLAHLIWDPNVRPGDAAFAREIRAAYRVGGEDIRRETIQLTIASGGTFDQETPRSGSSATFLQLFGMHRSGVPTEFDAEGRIWPRRGDPVLAVTGSAAPTVVRERFLVFPSLQPFARAGLASDLGNPSNDAIYVTPNEDLYSVRHPQPMYKLRLRFESDAGTDAWTLALGSTQLRPNSERIVLDDGRVLRRNTDYLVDYDLGRVTILRSDSLDARARQVTVRFEETPLFVSTPTSIFGVASEWAFSRGSLNFIAIGQRQHSAFTRPQLGFADESAIVAGLSGAFHVPVASWDRALQRLTGRESATPSGLRFEAEFATSRPLAGRSGEAYLESFESDGALTLRLEDEAWSYSSQPALGRNLATRFGGAAFDVSRASTMAWQTNGRTVRDSVVSFTLQQIDPQTKLAGGGIEQPERALWLTLYPLSIGGVYDDATRRHRWRISNAPVGRRWRSIRQVLGAASGVNLIGKETLEFWALVDTTVVRRRRNPTVILDLGDVSENGVAIVPTQLSVIPTSAGRDSVWSGRAVVGRDTLQSERDAFSRAFNQQKDDIGLPGDVVPRLFVTSPDSTGIQLRVPLCQRGNLSIARLGDTRTNCTVANGRLDEWDIDADNVLNFDAAQRERERVFRYVSDLSDSRSWSRVGGCIPAPNDSLGAAAPRQCWVLVRLPVAAPHDTINGGPSLSRVRALRMTVLSGETLADGEFSQLVVTRLRLAGAAWLKRSDRTLTGVAGERAGAGFVFASSIGTQDSLSALGYQSPPGVVEGAERPITGLETERVVVNEHAMRLTATGLRPLERAEAVYRFPEGARNFRQYRELRVWARGRGNGWGQGGELQFFVKIGRDANSFYAYRTTAGVGATQAAWLPELRVDFDRLYALRAQLENSYLQGRPDSLACTGADLALIAASGVPAGTVGRRAACSGGYIVYAADAVVAPPNLTAVQELAVGMVRVDSAGTGAGRLSFADTAEVWVNDIRLAEIVATPGYAGQVGVRGNLGDLAEIRVGVSRRDPNFRQLAEAPTYLTDQQVDVSGTVRLDRLLPGTSGWAAPLTFTAGRGSTTPEFLTRSDVRAEDIAALRTPEQRTTGVALSVRRASPLAGGWIAPLVNHVSANFGAAGTTSRSEFQEADQGRLNAGVDYAIGGDSPAGAMPAWWTKAFDRLPRWLGGSEIARAMRDARPRLQPASFRASGNYMAIDESRANFLTVAPSPRDPRRTTDGRTNAWRNSSAIELRPFDALSARWEVSSTRDLVDYGDSTLTARVASAERSSLLGLDAGLERERAVTSTYALAPVLTGWLRPRADFTTSYGHLRDPNARVLLREGDTTGALRLPRRVNASQVLNVGFALDFARLGAASGTPGDSARRRFLDRAMLPVDISLNRTLTSAFDGTPRTPGLGLQLGFGGEDRFLADGGFLATTAASNAQVAIATGFRLPFGSTLDVRTQRLSTRNWLRRPDKSQVIVDGELTTLPELSFRNTVRPGGVNPVVASITTTARLVATRQRSIAPGSRAGIRDLRSGSSLSYPVSIAVAWNDGGALTTGASLATSVRTDSMPGSRLETTTRDVGADIVRAFKLPAEWELRSGLRTRLSYQRATTVGFVETIGNTSSGALKSRLADAGREAISFNADTDVAENLTFSLQGARIITFDVNANRRISQVVFSAVLQIAYFAGELR